MKKITHHTPEFLLFFILILIFCGTAGSFVLAKKPDRSTSTIPTTLTSTENTDTTVTLAWNVSPNNAAVTNYDVYLNNTYLASTTDTTYTVRNLTPATSYQFYIKAMKTKKKVAATSNTITVTTKDTSSSDSTPVDSSTDDTTPVDSSSGDSTPVDSSSGDSTPVDSSSGDTTPVDSSSDDTTPVDSSSGDSTPADSSSGDSTPVDSSSGDSTPVDSSSGDSTTPVDSSLSTRIVGYYAAWAAYYGYDPTKVDASKLTHINYAFANIGSDLKLTLGYPDIDENNIRLLNSLKNTNPNLKTLISVGGWSWSQKFSDAALTDASRTAFADSCVNFITQYGFDGVDLDWEYPVSGGLATNVKRPEDKQNFTLLLQKIRQKLDERGAIDNKHYLLTIAGGADRSYSNNVELGKIANYLDYATLMTYDLHGMWDSYTDLHAPLYDNTDVSPQYKASADSSVKTWINASFPAEKLVLGIPFYGYIYSSVANVNNGLYQPYGGANSISYQDIVNNYLNKPGYTRHFHSQSKVPWLFDGSVFISYEDSESISYKTNYIKSQNLGGAMIWELSQDPNGELLNTLFNTIK